MLRSLKETFGHGLDAIDGKIGKVDDFYFDDVTWVVRYLVADTRRWLPGRLVLVSPVALGEPDWDAKALPVALTTSQIRNAPGIQTDKPVSRQYEAELARYYAWPTYWTDDLPYGPLFSEGVAEAARTSVAERQQAADGTDEERTADPDLRSVREVVGYDIKAADGDMGHVHDLIADTVSWTIRYAVIDTKKWRPGEQILVAPRWIGEIDWGHRQLRVNLTKEMIESCPRFNPEAPISREYEAQLHDHYGLPKYWE
jgi:hypothetical protein